METKDRVVSLEDYKKKKLEKKKAEEAAALGLPETATLEEMNAELKRYELELFKSFLGLSENASLEEVLEKAIEKWTAVRQESKEKTK